MYCLLVPDWPVIPESILKLTAPVKPLIAPRPENVWHQVGEPDRIEVVRLGLKLMGRSYVGSYQRPHF